MIVIIDMHIRDERLLDWLKEHDGQQIPAKKMARVMRCHENTIRAMLKRLERANQITRTGSYRGGYRYHIVKDDVCNVNFQ